MAVRAVRTLGGELRIAFLAGLAGVLASGFALLIGPDAGAGDGATYLGFRLLDLENQSVRWQTPTFGAGAVVTYAFANAPITTEGARNCARMVPPEAAYAPSQISEQSFRDEVAAAFRMWEGVADITFRETADTATAGILIGAQADPVGRAFTNVSLSGEDEGRKVIGRSLICLNPKQPWKVGFDGRLDTYDLRYTMAHEIGHAIGLDHPSAAGQLMSYRYDEKQTDLQAGDIKGAALLYGPRPGTRSFAATGPAETANAAPDAENGRLFGIGDRNGSSTSPVSTGSLPDKAR